jgi:hypothetical protein
MAALLLNSYFLIATTIVKLFFSESTVDINPSLYGNTNHDINANHEIWSFVSNYELNRTIGDLNQDGVLDVLDIVEIVDCILGDPAENCLYGDVNEDGIVDVIDVVQMVSLILGR